MARLFLPALARSAVAKKAFPKQCGGCGRSYSYAKWLRLPGMKFWKMPWGEIHEMRDCSCGSTMHICLVEGEPE